VPTRRWLVNTDPTNNTFLADVNFTLHRYDNPTVTATSEPILVRMFVELVERDTQTPVALATNLFVLDPAPTLATYLPAGSGLLQRPATNTFTRTLAFRPAPGVQMDSVNFLYRARVTISHVEQVDPFFAGDSHGQSGFAHQPAVSAFQRPARFRQRAHDHPLRDQHAHHGRFAGRR
jgi:hypothetical protein